MATYEATVPSTWSAQETFDYLADFRSVADWDPSMESAELISGDAGKVGARYRLTMSMLGHSTELEYEAISVQPPHEFVVRSESSAMVSTDTVTVAPDASVTYHAELELRGVRKLVAPWAQLALNIASTRAKRSLERTLAGEPTPTGQTRPKTTVEPSAVHDA